MLSDCSWKVRISCTQGQSERMELFRLYCKGNKHINWRVFHRNDIQTCHVSELTLPGHQLQISLKICITAETQLLDKFKKRERKKERVVFSLQNNATKPVKVSTCSLVSNHGNAAPLHTAGSATVASCSPLLLDCATIFQFLSIYSAWSGDARHQNNNFQVTLLCLSTIFLACKVLAL